MGILYQRRSTMGLECQGGLYEDNILARGIRNDFLGGQKAKSQERDEPDEALRREGYTLPREGGRQRKEDQSILR